MPYFDAIYQAAKNQDKKIIRQLITEGACIDERAKNTAYLTVAAKLAYEGDTTAALWLFDNFGASIQYIAYGAALRGDFTLTEKLYAQYPSTISFIVQGAAQGGFYEYAKKMFDQSLIDQPYNRYRIGSKWVYGIGQSKNAAEIQAVFKLGHGNHEVAVGVAYTGDSKLAEELRQQMPPYHLPDMAKHAAIGGYKNYAEQLRLRYGIPIPHVAHGAALGGDFNYVKELLAHHTAILSTCNDTKLEQAIHTEIINEVTKGAAEAGYRVFAKSWAKKYAASLKNSIKGAIAGGHKAYVEELLRSPTLSDHTVIIAEAGLYRYFEDAASALHFLSFINNDKVRSKIAGSIENYKLKIGIVPPNINMLLPKAQFINQHMTQYNLTYTQALIWSSSEIQQWLLHIGKWSTLTHLNQAPLLIIGTYLTEVPEIDIQATYQHLAALANNVSLYKKEVIKDFRSYADGSYGRYLGCFFGGTHRSRAQRLLNVCEASQSKKELITILGEEKNFAQHLPADDYHKLLEEHFSRLKC